MFLIPELYSCESYMYIIICNCWCIKYVVILLVEKETTFYVIICIWKSEFCQAFIVPMGLKLHPRHSLLLPCHWGRNNHYISSLLWAGQNTCLPQTTKPAFFRLTYSGGEEDYKIIIINRYLFIQTVASPRRQCFVKFVSFCLFRPIIYSKCLSNYHFQFTTLSSAWVYVRLTQMWRSWIFRLYNEMLFYHNV